jgi:superfamily II DNA or RNA helicase
VTELFERIRETCPPDAWSRGVTLAREGAVAVERSDAEETVARVTLRGTALTPTVCLFPEDGEWECDCESPLVACEHVAAVVIALRQGTLSKDGPRRLEYRLSRTPEGLSLTRGVTDDAGSHPIEMPLARIAAGTFHGPRFDATQQDLQIEKSLKGHLRGALPRAIVGDVVKALSRVALTLDGDGVVADPNPVTYSVRVEDVNGGFLLRLVEPVVDESFANGLVLLDGAVRPVGEPRLTGRERDELTRGRIYRSNEVATLVGEVLPSLRKRIALEVRTGHLPAESRDEARPSVFCRRDGDRLYVLLRVVYGDPPKARVEDGRLVSLGSDVPLRDEAGERAVEERASRALGIPVGRGTELSTEEAIELVAKLDGFDGVVEGDGHEAFRLHPELAPSLTMGDEDFEVEFETSGTRADPRRLLEAFREGRPLVALSGGGYAPLPLDWLDRYGDRIADLLAARDVRGVLPRAALFDLARLAQSLDVPPPAGFEGLKDLAVDLRGLPEAPLEPELRHELRDYQRSGVDWLVFLRKARLGALLADDMGLGKTLQALCALEGKCLVVAPTSVLPNWISEARKFRPGLSLSLYHGSSRALDPTADVTVTSHALLRQDRDVFTSISWDVVVLDEGQAIKNPESQLARAAYGLDASFRVSLTGTPIENRLVDLWSQLHFVVPGLLGGLSDFEARYVRPIEKGETEPWKRLRERIRPFFLRRLKSDVAPELPPRTEIALHAELEPSEREVYEAVRLSARKDVMRKLESKGGVLAALEALLRLRQAACHPALVPGQSAPTSSKTELLMSSLETATSEEHKSIVFSQWTSMLDLLEPHLKARNLGFVRLDGATRDRGAVVERFQKDEAVPVFLVSLKAGGTGLNLTAADHVFLFDPWWNPAVEEQAFDRAHRIGQTKPVFVHRLVADDTVEERILALQEEKRALADLTVAGGGAALTREDLLRLIE